MKLFHLLLLFLSTVLLAYGEVTESYLRTEILGLANSSVTERRFEAAMLFRERWRFLGPKEATDIAARLLADGEVRVTEEMLLSLKGMAPTEPEFNRFLIIVRPLKRDVQRIANRGNSKTAKFLAREYLDIMQQVERLARKHVTFDGAEQTMTLRPEDRRAGARFDRFGVFNLQTGGHFVDIAVDDVRFTSGR